MNTGLVIVDDRFSTLISMMEVWMPTMCIIVAVGIVISIPISLAKGWNRLEKCPKSLRDKEYPEV